MARILIAGCGDLGIATGLRFVEAGHEVHALRRHPERLPSRLRPFAADLADRASLEDLGGPYDQVVYCAAADEGTEEAYERAYVTGVRNLLDALSRKDHPVHRFLFVSSTAVHGQDAGEWVDEESVTEPSSFRGAVLLRGEQLVRGSSFPATILRLAGIYGPGRLYLIERIRNGQGILAEDPPHYTNRIHRDDAAGLIVHLVGLSGPEEVYLGVDHDPAPRSEVHAWLAERMGIDSGAPADPPRPTRQNKRCRNNRVVASGYSFVYPTFREGYARILADLS